MSTLCPVYSVNHVPGLYQSKPSPEGLGNQIPEEDPSAVGAALCHPERCRMESAVKILRRYRSALFAPPRMPHPLSSLSGCAQPSHTEGFSDAGLGKARFSR